MTFEDQKNILQCLRDVLEIAYNSAEPVCCGRPGVECCGSPEPEWRAFEQTIMDTLGPAEKALAESVQAAANQQGILDGSDHVSDASKMVPEMLPIAQRKIEQMGGEVMGVVVRRDDGILVAVTDSGRVTRLDDAVAGPVRDGAQGAEPVASDEPLSCPFCGDKPEWVKDDDPSWPQVQCKNLECPISHSDWISLDAWNRRAYTQPADQAVVAGKSWTEELIDSAIRELVTIAKQVEIANTVGGQWPATAHQEAEKCDHLKRIAHHLGNLRVVTDSAHPQPDAKVPEETEEMVDAAVKVFEDAGADVDLGWLGEACRAYVAAASTTPQQSGEWLLTTPQQSGEWVRCSDRLPNAYRPVAVAYHSDADGKPCLDTGAAALQPDGSWIGLGVFYRPNLDAGTELKNDLSKKSVTHWMPLPNPPKQEGSGDE